MLYHTMVFTGRPAMRHVTRVEEAWLRPYLKRLETMAHLLADEAKAKRAATRKDSSGRGKRKKAKLAVSSPEIKDAPLAPEGVAGEEEDGATQRMLAEETATSSMSIRDRANAARERYLARKKK